MTHQSLARLCALASALAVLLCGLVSQRALAGGPSATSPVTREFPVAPTAGYQAAPAISGRTVVWVETRARHQGLYRANLSTGRVFSGLADSRIISPPFGSPSPSIDGSIVVWMDCRSCSIRTFPDEIYPPDTRVYWADLTTGRVSPISMRAGAQAFPAVNGRVVVWVESRGGRRHIRGKDLATGREFQVSTGSGEQTTPAISDGMVAWAELRDVRSGNWDIWGKDLASGRTVPIALHTGAGDYMGDPLINGRTVIWTHWHPDRSLSIDGKDLATGRAFQVVRLRADQFNPQFGVHKAFDGRVVVWDQARREPFTPGDANIVGKDLTTGRTLRITQNGNAHAWPSISGVVVVWQSIQAQRGTIWVANLSLP